MLRIVAGYIVRGYKAQNSEGMLMVNVEFENRWCEQGSMGPRGLEDYGSEGLQLIKEKLTLHYPPSSTPYRTM